ncbi:MAG: vanadium-dependent haloperoxidase [Myxococcota bacterium]|nr:vanadium-dependent haloperoxidase [Myxococcota bacterium]
MKLHVVALPALLSLLIAAAPSESRAEDTVTRWMDQALDTTRSERLGAAPASRLYAMVAVAMYDAVNAIDRARRLSSRPQALISSEGAPRFGDRRAAAAGAAHAVLSGLYPDLADRYDMQLEDDLDALGRRYRVVRGLHWGASVGDGVVWERQDDGSSPSETLPGGDAPGRFRADFTSAQYRNMLPFSVTDPLAYVSAGPPDLDSREYAVAFNEVRNLGDRSYPNADYDEIFNFWRAGGGSVRPPGEWIKIAIVVAGQEGTTRSISNTARLFALVGMALADSTIVAWNAKFDFAFWRPATAIQNAGTDGNPDTVEDPDWVQRNGSIGGSPEHTSGQSTYAGSASTVLAAFYCDENIPFTFEGDNAIAGPRSFESFGEAAAEAGRARIFAGIHFEFSNQQGQRNGRAVGREIAREALKRSGLLAKLRDCPVAHDHRPLWFDDPR